jgi:GxxExxY protein
MEINEITRKVIGCSIEVHKNLGPGLLESVYETALCIELEEQNLKFERQKEMLVYYRDKDIGKFIIDILVEHEIVLELKSVEKHNPIFEAQLLSYLKMGGYKIGLLINFNSHLLKHGIKRIRL